MSEQFPVAVERREDELHVLVESLKDTAWKGGEVNAALSPEGGKVRVTYRMEDIVGEAGDDASVAPLRAAGYEVVVDPDYSDMPEKFTLEYKLKKKA